MDVKSGMMKYQTGSHGDIISFIINGRGKSVHVQDDKVFVCDTDSKRKKNLKNKSKYVTEEISSLTHKIMRKVANLGIRKHLKVTRETSEE